MKYVSGRIGRADVAFFLQNLAGGGAERALIWLAGEIAKQGYSVDFVLSDPDCDYREEIIPEINIFMLAARSPLQVVNRLAVYLRRYKPVTIMSALDLPNIMLVAAAKLAGYKGRTVISQRAVVDASYSELTSTRRVLTKLLQRLCFPHADVLISNSKAASVDVRTQFRLASDRIITIPNALDTDRVTRLAREPLESDFIARDRVPLIVSVGSLTRRKDMGTLIAAFDIVQAQRPARLVIVGKGPEQGSIEQLIAERGLDDRVHLAGFDANPYKWMAAADVFVSSSTAEGFPNVIAETLALGRPIVATDCPGDTAEILEHGRWGRLVPVGDPQRMADAIMATLSDSHPLDGRMRAAYFSPAKVLSAYLDALLPGLAQHPR